jgi:cytoskeletal protein CcmA (bactofilin family)
VSKSVTEIPQRRFVEQTEEAPTLVGAGGVFEGRLAVAGPMTLSGTIIGDGTIGGALSIAAGAHWRGNVQAASVVLAGRMTGGLTVEGKLEIGSKAVLRGSVNARIVAIAEGGIVEGEMHVTGPEPVSRFVEKRASSA